jgi:cell division septation protein DedD
VISEQEVTDAQDTEITLGTGKLLGIFVALVVLCAVFFAFGFSMGRNSVKAGLNLTEAPDAEPAPAAAKPTPTAILRPTPVSSQPVETSAAEDSKPAEKSEPAVTPAAQVTPAADTSHSAASGYVVQIAAVSKQEDADALVGALKKKGYPVFIADSATDKLLHVQIGPFADIKDAESMRTRLTADGYNPILKR